MTPEFMTALFTGIVGLIGALSAFSANRSKQVSVDLRILRSRVRALEKQNLDLQKHVFRLERELVKLGADVPARPTSLEHPLDDDEVLER